MKWLAVLILPFALAGCVTERAPMLPMALAPSDAAQAACLTYGDTPTFGDCNAPDAISVPGEPQ